MPPHWAIVAGWIFLALGFASALVILVDELLLGHRQRMWVMNLVHPITALYWGPVWLYAYFTRARAPSSKGEDGGEPTRWQVANATSHCGAGCTLGDIVGEWTVFAIGWTIAGVTLWPELLLDLPLAWAFGIVFQYFTIVPMREDVGRLQGLWLAIRADTLSILSFQVGLFGWMILSAKVLWAEPLHVDTPTHWWMMQVGMILGFFTSYPVNRWLVRKGWKERMG